MAHSTHHQLWTAVNGPCSGKPPGRLIAESLTKIAGLGRHYQVTVVRSVFDEETEEWVEEEGDFPDYYANGCRYSADTCEPLPLWTEIVVNAQEDPLPACNDAPPQSWHVASVEKYYNAENAPDNADDIEWAGITTGASGAIGRGYFKNTLPDKYQDTFALAAGSIYRISGYGTQDSSGTFDFNFTSAAPGTAGTGVGASVIEEHTLATFPNAGWEFFSFDLTAPTGTTSGAFSRTGSASFDEVKVELLELGAGTVVEPCGH